MNGDPRLQSFKVINIFVIKIYKLYDSISCLTLTGFSPKVNDNKLKYSMNNCSFISIYKVFSNILFCHIAPNNLWYLSGTGIIYSD